MLFIAIFLSIKIIITHIQCRSATAAVEERCRACINAQGNHFQRHLMRILMLHLMNKVVGTNKVSFIYLLCLNNS